MSAVTDSSLKVRARVCAITLNALLGEPAARVLGNILADYSFCDGAYSDKFLADQKQREETEALSDALLMLAGE